MYIEYTYSIYFTYCTLISSVLFLYAYEKGLFLYCKKPIHIQYDQPFVELELPLPEEKKIPDKQGIEIYQREQVPLVPDSTEQFDITDKFDISKKDTFEM